MRAREALDEVFPTLFGIGGIGDLSVLLQSGNESWFTGCTMALAYFRCLGWVFFGLARGRLAWLVWVWTAPLWFDAPVT